MCNPDHVIGRGFTEMAGNSEDNVFKEFYTKLLKILPTSNLASELYCHKLLSSNHKTAIDGLSANKDKAAYFLDRVIKPALEIGYTELFDETLRLMETSDDSAVVFVAEEIKRKICGGSRDTQLIKGSYRFSFQMQYTCQPTYPYISDIRWRFVANLHSLVTSESYSNCALCA